MRKGKTQEGKGLRVLGVVLLCIGVLGAIMALVDGKISTAIVAIIIFGGAGVILLKKGVKEPSINPPSKPASVGAANKNNTNYDEYTDKDGKISIPIKVSIEREEWPAPDNTDGPITLPVIDLSGYKSPSGGYANYAEYDIDGYVLNKKTGEKTIKRARRLTAKDEKDALEKFQEKYGDIAGEPNIRLIPAEPPTDKQLKYIHDYNVIIPDDISKEDASAIINRVAYGHTMQASESFAKLADTLGCLFSRYIDGESLVTNIAYRASDRERIAFYAYCIVSFEKKVNVITSDDFPELPIYYKFADNVIDDERFMKSLEKRWPEDYLKPNRNTITYKAVADYFKQVQQINTDL